MFDNCNYRVKVSVINHFSSNSVKSMLSFWPDFCYSSSFTVGDEMLHRVYLSTKPVLVGDGRMFTFVVSKNVPLLIKFVVDEPSMVTPFSNRTFVVVKDFGSELKVSILPVPSLPISA